MFIKEKEITFDERYRVLFAFNINENKIFVDPINNRTYSAHNSGYNRVVYVRDNYHCSNHCFAEYDNDLDMLCFACFELKIKLINDIDFEFNSKEIFRFYVDKSKHIIIKNKLTDEYKDIGLASKKQVQNNRISFYDLDATLVEIHKMFDYVVCKQGNSFGLLQTVNDFIDFICYKEPKKMNSQNQKMIDEFSKLELKEIKYSSELKYVDKFAVVEKVNKNLSVVRLFYVSEDLLRVYEGSRIYIDDKKYYPCKKLSSGEYVYISGELNRYHWLFPIYDISKKDFENTRLEYLYDVLKEVNPEKRCLCIFSFLRWDIFEKFYKAGYKNFCLNCFEYEGGTSFDELKCMFNRIDLKGYKKNTTIYDFSKMNKYQLNKMNQLFYSYDEYFSCKFLIRYLKVCLGDDLYFIDNKTFDKALEIVRKFIFDYCIYDFMECIEIIVNLKGFSYVYSNILKINKIFEHENFDSYIIWRKYKDYLNMVNHPKLKEIDYPLVFNSIEELKKNHDDIIPVYNAIRDEFNVDKFEELSRTWNKYSYSNEKYSITIPKTPVDIINEGTELHHCVKTYIKKVLQQETIILFLRKNNDLDVPYFTIELKGDKVIQIHGAFNCNLKEDSSEREFIRLWAKEKKLKLNNYDKIR